jgi:homoserine trans-succinylase
LAYHQRLASGRGALKSFPHASRAKNANRRNKKYDNRELAESNSKYVVILNRLKEIDVYEVNHYKYPDTTLTDDRFETKKEALDAANRI